MKKGNKILNIAASTGLLSLISFAAFASPSTTATFEKMIQAKAEQRLVAEESKYTRIAMLAGNRQNELVEKKNEVSSTYKNWHDLKTAVVSHYPNATDFRDIENAAKAYSQANKAFINLQKDILAQNANTLDPVAINSLLSAAPTASGLR
jgi:hypothetical protein